MTGRCVHSSVGAGFDSVESLFVFGLFSLGGECGGGGGGRVGRQYGKEVGEMLGTI